MKEKDTAAYKLFHVKFFVSIPSVYTKPPAYYDVYGVVDTGDRVTNQLNMMSYEATYKTAAELAELVNDGVVVKSLTEDDANKIFTWIEQYLHDWLIISNTDHHRRDFPLDWIAKFEVFKEALAPLANVAHNLRPVSTLFKNDFGTGVTNFKAAPVKPLSREDRKDSKIGYAIEEALLRRGKIK